AINASPFTHATKRAPTLLLRLLHLNSSPSSNPSDPRSSMMFDIFNLLQCEYSTLPGQTFGTYNFSIMFSIPQGSPMDVMNNVPVEDNNDRCKHPQCQGWTPQRFTPQMTPSNHQF
ncbi:hypothetical protein J1N35_029165, partial [Gossypium stocksii]